MKLNKSTNDFLIEQKMNFGIFSSGQVRAEKIMSTASFTSAACFSLILNDVKNEPSEFIRCTISFSSPQFFNGNDSECILNHRSMFVSISYALIMTLKCGGNVLYKYTHTYRQTVYIYFSISIYIYTHQHIESQTILILFFLQPFSFQSNHQNS